MNPVHPSHQMKKLGKGQTACTKCGLFGGSLASKLDERFLTQPCKG